MSWETLGPLGAPERRAQTHGQETTHRTNQDGSGKEATSPVGSLVTAVTSEGSLSCDLRRGNKIKMFVFHLFFFAIEKSSLVCLGLKCLPNGLYY